MKKLLLLTTVLISLTTINFMHAQTNAVTTEKTASKTASKTEQELNRITRKMFDAELNGDKQAFGYYLAEDFLFTGPTGQVVTKEQMLEGIHKEPAGTSMDFEDRQVKEYGNTAIGNGIYKEVFLRDGQKITQRYRFTEAFIKQSGEWKLISIQLSAIHADKTPATIDPAVYDACVGQYDIGNNQILTTTREGNKLIQRITGDNTTYELLPEYETTFYIKGRPHQVTTFVKDDKGQVSHMLYHLVDGQKLKAKKIK